jgi:SAM-dependent methyltransferase
VFNRLLELPVGIVAAAVLAFVCLRDRPLPSGKFWAGLLLAAAVALLALPAVKSHLGGRREQVIERSRNFYGTLVVSDVIVGGGDTPEETLRVLGHGTTTHGQQFLSRPKEPTLYYREGSAVSFALREFPRQENRHVGLVGLGVGTLAAYGKPGDTFRFYEIDPDVERLARKHFSFLADSPANVEVVLGDARLTLEREQPQQFDVLVLDAFSGDAIPVHLLTAEAFDLYMRHLKPDGVLAIHFSNRAADLGWVLLRQANRLGLSVVGDDRAGWWMLMSRDRTFLNSPAMQQGTRAAPAINQGPLWTDDHVNLMQVIRWLTR